MSAPSMFALIVMPFALLIGAIFLARKSGLIKKVQYSGEVVPQSTGTKVMNVLLVILCAPVALWTLLSFGLGSPALGGMGLGFIGFIMTIVTTKHRRTNKQVANLTQVPQPGLTPAEQPANKIYPDIPPKE